MHADRLVKKRKTQHVQLHAREPALINLPIPIPSNIPILSPLINPLVAGIPSSAFPLPIQSWPPLISIPLHTTQTTVQAPTQTPAVPTPTNAPAPTATPQPPATGNTPPSGDGSGNSQSPSSNGSGGSGGGSGGSSENSSGGSGGGGQVVSGSSSSNVSPSGAAVSQLSGGSVSAGVAAAGSSGSDATGGRTFADGSPVPTQNAAVNAASNPSSGSDSDVSVGVSGSVTYTGAGSRATDASGHNGGGTSSGGNGTGGGDDPTTGSGATDAGSHKSFPIAAIIALAVIGALGLLALVVFCCRRSSRARIARRRIWSRGEKRESVYGAVGSSGFFRENDDKSVRSSFGTTFEQHTDPFRLSHQPPVPLGSDWPLYNSEMAQVAETPQISVPVPVAIVCKPPSPTIRGESRPNSMGSDISNPFDDTAHPEQVLLVPERGVMSPDLPGTPLSVRPFSPSERWSFPMPPTGSSHRASSQFPSRTTSASPVTFDTLHTSDYATAQGSENPFTDFESSDAEHTSETYVTADTDAAAHFTRIEYACRPFEPTHSDEISVDEGDRVRVLKRFDDGWAYADNCTNGQRGLFPIDCLRMSNQELPDFLNAKRLSSYTSGSSSTRLTVVKEAGLV